MERGGANAMDRISELPQFIIHQILSYLSTKEAAQTSVLSKTWLQAWSTSPILDLNELYYSSEHQFFSFVNSTLLRYRTQNLRIHKFKILLFSEVDQASGYNLLNQSIGTALDHGVKELHIYILTRVDLSPPYALPQTIFSTSAMFDLKHLKLHVLSITDKNLNELVAKSPLLEVLNIFSCNGLERINVSGRSLKHLLLENCKNLLEANIDAPNLLTLKYNGDKVLSLSLVNTPEELMTFIDIVHRDSGWPNITWFHLLRKLLKSVSRANVSFYISLKGIQFGTDHLHLIENPLPLENFKPEINQSSSEFAAFVKTLFSIYRPTIISTPSWLSPYSVDFIKFLGYELISNDGRMKFILLQL